MSKQEISASVDELTKTCPVKLAYPSEINVCTKNLTLAEASAAQGQVQTLENFIDNGYPIAHLGELGSLLHVAVMYEQIDVVKALIKRGAPIDLPNSEGESPLMRLCSVRNGEAEERHQLELSINKLTAEEPTNKQISEIMTPHYKARNEIMQLLLKNGANPNQPNKENGKTPLHVATRNFEVVTLLLQHNADPNSTDLHKRKPLHYACRDGNECVVALLLKQQGANVNCLDKYGNLPLHYAVGNSHEFVAEELFSKNVCCVIANCEGYLPKDYRQTSLIPLDFLSPSVFMLKTEAQLNDLKNSYKKRSTSNQEELVSFVDRVNNQKDKPQNQQGEDKKWLQGYLEDTYGIEKGSLPDEAINHLLTKIQERGFCLIQ